MPISNRNRTVTLSKTKKKGRKHTEAVANAIEPALEDSGSSYVFTLQNMRNQRLKEFRERLKSTSREFQEYDFARTVNVATEKVELKEGPLEQFTHELEPYLRKQGLPVRLKKRM